MIDKNLFLYDLAVVAILKDEGHYLKEWLDYHLLAGVEHFYLYNNDSSDDYAEIIAPYVKNNLVTSTNIPGKLALLPAYNDAVKRFKFQCRYMAFIDLDEFIYPKTSLNIVEVVDEILSRDPNAKGLSIHWQEFGSNGQDKTDYSRGVLERFTRRARKDFHGQFTDSNGYKHYLGNAHLKIISNPRYIKQPDAHYAIYFEEFHTIDERGVVLPSANLVLPITADKIAINHYRCKSKEEFVDKLRRGSATNYPINEELFAHFDNNDEFDDGILKYIANRAENFSLKSDEQRFNRVITALMETLAAYASDEIFDLETALTCLALSTYLRKKTSDNNFKIYEEASLAAVLKSVEGASFAEGQLFIRELPKILRLPYPAVKEIRLVAAQIISQFMDEAKNKSNWTKFFEWDYVREFLKE